MDGASVLACKRSTVHDGALAQDRRACRSSVWTPRFRWEHDTLNLWSAFVEQLFDDPPDDERTWTNLHTLLRDPERNLLIDHLGLDEDARLDARARLRRPALRAARVLRLEARPAVRLSPVLARAPGRAADVRIAADQPDGARGRRTTSTRSQRS